jgi:hypothetical protein
LLKSTSGIALSDALEGSLCLVVLFLSVAFFIAPPLGSGCQPCADQSDLVLLLLDEDCQENAQPSVD